MRKHFSRKELECPCCGECHMDDGFLDHLEMARIIAGVPFPINSGYRCPKHNKEVGSSSRNHVDGKAVDICCLNSYNRARILAGLFQAGFRRIGIHGRYIHADTMDLPEAVWLYQGG